MQANYMTRASYERLSEEARRLKEVEIPRLGREKLEAASQGDLRENAGYEAARDRLHLLQARLAQISEQLAGVHFIEDLRVPGDIVSIATAVRLLDLDGGEEVEYVILGPADADADRHVISHLSPLARGMITKRRGEEFAVETPGGTRRFRVLAIRAWGAPLR
ncbi:MAG: GreA/GreB family elongation factor [bacterium]|nr:GreA/GreB family elongation factor [bacterium]